MGRSIPILWADVRKIINEHILDTIVEQGEPLPDSINSLDNRWKNGHQYFFAACHEFVEVNGIDYAESGPPEPISFRDGYGTRTYVECDIVFNNGPAVRYRYPMSSGDLVLTVLTGK